MGFDWEDVLDADSQDLAVAYDAAVSDALSQERLGAIAGAPVDPVGDE